MLTPQTDNNYNTLIQKIDELEKKIKYLEENKNNSKSIKIQSGEHFEEFWKDKDHFINACNVGYRPFVKHISFKERYETTPQVFVSLIGFDADKGYNCRLYVQAKDIDICGFNLEIATYGDSKIYYAKVSWVSFGY